MVNPVTLESVSSAFSLWRQNRVSRNESAPAVLRQQALQLLSHHSNNRVITALKINHAMLKRWQLTSEVTPASFVALPVDVPKMDCASSLQITLRNALGAEMDIGGELTSDLVLRLATSFTSTMGSGS